MLDPFNGDVLIEPAYASDGSVTYHVIIVGSAQRVGFGADASQARAYACREARRHGTRALERMPRGYTAVTGPS